MWVFPIVNLPVTIMRGVLSLTIIFKHAANSGKHSMLFGTDVGENEKAMQQNIYVSIADYM